MNKTKIEWCDYTINPVKGLCPMACSYCYARRMYKRFHWDETVRFEPEQAFVDAFNAPSGSRIFVGSTMELFGDWVKPNWLEQIMGWPKALPNKTFIFLTKQPQNLPKQFPDNCWVGASATNETMAAAACARLSLIEAKVKFLSIEPLLSWDCQNALNSRFHWQQNYHDINWLIIGQQTPPKKSTRPELAWVQNILVAMSNAGNIPVFMKNNLEPLLTGAWSGWKLRQELPR